MIMSYWQCARTLLDNNLHPLQEEVEDEDEANFVPDEILEEEERLRKKREGANKEALKVGNLASTFLDAKQSRCLLS